MSVLLYVTTSGVAAFGPPALFARSTATKLATLRVRGGAQLSSPALAASASSTGANSTEATATGNDDGDDSKVFRQAAVVGAVSAGMGYVYGKILDCTVKSVWKRLPHVLSERGTHLGGYIAYTCAVGGLLMGLLSHKLKPTYIVADFVSTLSGSGENKSSALPGLIPSLPNLLLLSLVTSTFGFSVGPEAPMVCAGGLVGAAMARNWYKSSNDNVNRAAEIMTYAGAAGALTAFMGIPLAGPIFALELTRASAGMTPSTRDALGPSIAASAVGLVLIRGGLMPGANVGGHFTYWPVGGLSGRAAIVTAIVCGTGGALLGTIFHKVVHILKDVLWKQQAPAVADMEDGGEKKSSFASFILHRDVLVKTLIGIVVGLLSLSYPQTMFWGEGSLQCVVDGQKTPFAATKHGLSRALTASARVNPDLPFQSAWDAAQIGLVKLLSIALACAGKFPGGIIFPLFFAAAPLAHAALTLLSSSLPAAVAPVAVMSLMASTQASVTRTPLATVFMLALSSSSATELSKMLPAVILSSYIGVWFSRFLSTESYFNYSA